MVSAFRDPYALPAARFERRAATARRGMFSSTMMGSAMWCTLLIASALVVARWAGEAPVEVKRVIEILPAPPSIDVPMWKPQSRPAGGSPSSGTVRPVAEEPVLPIPTIAPTSQDIGPPTDEDVPRSEAPVSKTPIRVEPAVSEEPAAYVDVIPEAYRKVEPEYPEIARTGGIEGLVRMEVVVARDGTVRSTRILEPGSLFDEAATRAATAWRFHPATVNGHPVPAKVGLTFRFKLH